MKKNNSPATTHHRSKKIWCESRESCPTEIHEINFFETNLTKVD
jgi:hypothetical protein